MPDDKKRNNILSVMAYMSDFYYVIGIIIFLIAIFFMFNEPVGASMLSFDMSVVLVVFAILYAAAKDNILKFLAKYLVLIGFMITAFQFMIDYGSLTVLQSLFWVSIVIFVINFIFDFLTFIPTLFSIIWSFVRGVR